MGRNKKLTILSLLTARFVGYSLWEMEIFIHMGRHILYERIIVDFVNAEDTDDACLQLIGNTKRYRIFHQFLLKRHDKVFHY